MVEREPTTAELEEKHELVSMFLSLISSLQKRMRDVTDGLHHMDFSVVAAALQEIHHMLRETQIMFGLLHDILTEWIQSRHTTQEVPPDETLLEECFKSAELDQDKYIILKRADCEKYLNDDARNRLDGIYYVIHECRQRDGKSDNKYWFCNQDEPYADEVIKLILEGEAAKLLSAIEDNEA